LERWYPSAGTTGLTQARLRVWEGDLPTRCPPPFAPSNSKDVEEEVDEKVRARALALAQQPRP
jgi:hypothetical protein